MGEYMKMSKLLANVLPRNTNNDNSNEISRYVYIKLYEIVEFYCKRTKELILDAKVLALPRFKSKSVNVRHICILDHCICLIGKITGEMLEE